MDIDKLESGLSAEKLKTFESTFSCKSKPETIAIYMAIQEICSHYFPLIQMVEVNLRNTIHKVATEHFKDDEWFTRVPVGDKSKEQVDFAVDQCLEDVGIKYTSDDVIARLSFGFWVHMLSSDYNNPRKQDKNLWQFKFQSAFPYAKQENGKPIKLSLLFQRLGVLNKFRNRLFHHEPVWKYRNVIRSRDGALGHLQKRYNEHLEFLGWMSESHVKLYKELEFKERFDVCCTKERLDTMVSKLEVLFGDGKDKE